ncbi:hypothetical protein FBU30_005200 [Linnemannia zychae]|nr:hypothetical protein FBU30_005200 [Linnemannia zychae]
MDEETAVKAKRVQKMAKDLIDIKRNEFTLLIPRHILHEDDELFVVKLPHANAKPLRIPPRLMTLPRDANFLVEVFFEHAYYYYPILNRAVVELCLMESHTPAAMLLLNTVFMVACKHMPRTEDTLRAIEFRERVRELRWCFEDKSQLNYMIAEMIGFMSVYGLFGIAPGQMEFCGTHRTMASKASGAIHSNPETELLENGVSRSTLPEINHQTKLWVFWSLYLRDCICKLYFGFHFGIDAKPMTAELPKIRNFVGLGGRVAPSNQHKGTSGASEATKKRRETSFGRDRQYPPDKRFLQDKERQNRGILDDRTQFRNAREYSSDSDESENDETTSSQREGSGDRDVFMPSQAERRPGASGSNFIGRTMATLSRELLESQSRGDSMPYGVSDTTENLDPQALKAHMERMEILLRSQDDPTDDGSYARVLFLEEIRLWTIGRRLSAYLSGRTATDVPVHSTSVSNSACGGSPKISSVYENGERSSRESLGMWSEQAWAQDQELQSLQADLIAWEKSIPKHLRFRSDVDHPDINHKVNGKMSVIMVAYYTITILLQSSYLPKPPEALRSKSSPKKPTSPIVNSYDNRKDTTESCRDNTPPHQWSRSRSESASAPLKETSRTSAVDDASTQAEDHTYYNTAHRICTELSNVILHHIEIMLDRYTRWCTIQAKINHALIAAQRVACLNARLDGNSSRMREEAKAGFRMGSDLYKRLAVLPAPLVIYDRPPVEDINYMNDLEKVFDQMVVSQDEERETQRLSMEQEHEHVDQDSQDPMSQKQNLGAKDGILDSYVIDPDEDGPLPTTDTIVDTSQGLQIYGGEGTEGYAFEFEETSLKGSFPLLLNPHDIHE